LDRRPVALGSECQLRKESEYYVEL
jgi:hypothetical protein